MNSTTNKFAVIGSAALVLVLSFVVAAFPAPAQAQAGYTAYQPYGYQQPYQTQYPCAKPFVYPNGYYYCGTYATNPVYPVPQQPTYPQQPQYQALSVSCYSTNSSVAAGTSAQWTAQASGGAGSYTYSWSGTDGLYGSGPTAYMTYYNPGYKTASVAVYSGGQTTNVACSGSINVFDNTYYQYPSTYVQPVIQIPNHLSSNANGLQIGCYSDPVTASINQPVTWNVEVTGGAAPYMYSWSGSDGLTGTGATAIKYYQSSGQKSAVISVTSADGRNATWACSNTVTVRGAGTVAPARPVTPVVEPVNDLSANSLFALGNIPWGWVAVLVILVLFAAVMYLLFNKTKI